MPVTLRVFRCLLRIASSTFSYRGMSVADSGAPEPGVSWVACESLHKDCTTAKPPQARAKVESRSGSSRTSQIVGHRTALISPSRVQNGALDTPQAPVSIEADVAKRSNERVPGDTARAYFSFALGGDGRGGPNGAKWIGTQLFPSPIREDDVVDSEESCLWESLRGDAVEVGPTRSLAGPTEESFKGAINRRVRRRPDSWGARSFDEHKGWLGTWPRGECWDDGHGYLKLRPFPASEEIDGLDTTLEGGKEVQRTGTKVEKSSDHEDIAPLSRADRVFRVFACLQPARQALKLDEELSVTSRPSKRSETCGKRPLSDDYSECHEMTKDRGIDQETTRARDPSPLRRMETNVANETGCISRHKDAKDTRNPSPLRSENNDCEETNMSSRGDQETALARVSSRVSQIATKVVDSSRSVSAEREIPKIVADAVRTNDEEARNAFEKSNAYSKSVGLKILHAAPSSRPNEKDPKSILIPKPLIASRQYHPPGETSSKHGRLGKGIQHAQASVHTIDLTSEASPPSKLGEREIGKSCDHSVKPYAIDTREGDKSSPRADDASAEGYALPKRVGVGVEDFEAAESSRVKFSVSAQAATDAPRHVSASGQHPPSPCAPSTAHTLPPGVERGSMLETNTSLTSGLQPPLCRASNTLQAESEDIRTASVCKSKMVGSGASQPRMGSVILPPSTSIKTAPRPRGSLNSRASSGVVRNMDLRTDARQNAYQNPAAISGTASTGHVMDTAYQGCGGRIADVAQRVSLLTE